VRAPETVTAAQRLEFRQQGYLLIDSGLPDATIRALVDELEPFWGPDRIIPEGAAMSLPNRIQDYWRISRLVHEAATAPKVLAALEALYGRAPRPFQTLNFNWGTEQAVHSDSIHFNSEPFGLMCGVWLALEDIGPDQGPLVYYPGSQDLPEMNFEDFGLAPSYDNYPEYEIRLRRFIDERRLQPAYAEIRRGQALIWSANLLHGGSPHRDRALTRRSQVTHYYFDGARPWRPGRSIDGHSFEPDWIPLTWPEQSADAPADAESRLSADWLLASGRRLRRALRPRTRLRSLRTRSGE
jgi:hypothetical protein